MKIKTFIGLAALSALLQTGVEAASLRYGGRRLMLPETGINFVAFQNLKAIPKTPPKINSSWKNSRTGESISGYEARELWLFDQIEGVWKNDIVTVRVGGMRNAVADSVPTINGNTNSVRVQTYNKWKVLEGKMDVWRRRDINEWLKEFCLTTIADKTFKRRFSRYELTEYQSKSEPQYHRIYLLKTSRADKLKIVLHFEFNRPITTNDKVAIARSIRTVAFTALKRKRSKEVWTANKYANKSNNGNYSESRKRAISSIKNMRDWWYIESKNYIIVSNMRSKNTGRQLQKRLEQSREAFEVLFPLKKPIDDVSVVRIFNEHNEYMPYVGKGFEWSAGLWKNDLRELLVSPGFSRTHQKKKESLGNTVTHEGFHQYIFYSLNHRTTAPWFNEGTADFFGSIAFPSSRTFRVGLASGRYYNFMRMRKMGKDVIAPLLDLNYTEFYSEKKGEYYSLAWALMFYLYKGTFAADQLEYAKIPYRYYNAALDGQSQSEATKTAWRGIDHKQFQKDFRAFWGNQLLVSRARSLSLKHILGQSKIKYSR